MDGRRPLGRLTVPEGLYLPALAVHAEGCIHANLVYNIVESEGPPGAFLVVGW
jgi:hypothetical protein